MNGIHAAKCCEIIGVQDAGRPFRELQELYCLLVCAVGIAVRCLQNVFLRNRQAQLECGFVETGKSSLCNSGIHAVNVGNAPVAFPIDVLNKVAHSGYVIGLNDHAIVKNVVDGNNRDRAADQLGDAGIIEINAGDTDTVKAAVPCMLQIGHAVYLRTVTVDKC